MTTTRNAKADVPGLLLGDFLFSSQPSRHNEADARLVLRMAMTGVTSFSEIDESSMFEYQESLSDLRSNLRNTYGPLMNLDTLVKLMTSRQDGGKTLFYADSPSTGDSGASSRGPLWWRRSSQGEGKSSVKGQRRSKLVLKANRNFEGIGGSIASELIQGASWIPFKDYFRTIHRLFGGFQDQRRPSKQPQFRSFASVSTNSDFAPEEESKPQEENVIETVPLQVMISLFPDHEV